MTTPPTKPAARMTAELFVKKGEVGDATPPRPVEDERRVQLTSRVLESTSIRIREYAHKAKISKQDLIDAALKEYLDKMGG